MFTRVVFSEGKKNTVADEGNRFLSKLGGGYLQYMTQNTVSVADPDDLCPDPDRS